MSAHGFAATSLVSTRAGLMVRPMNLQRDGVIHARRGALAAALRLLREELPDEILEQTRAFACFEEREQLGETLGLRVELCDIFVEHHGLTPNTARRSAISDFRSETNFSSGIAPASFSSPRMRTLTAFCSASRGPTMRR